MTAGVPAYGKMAFRRGVHLAYMFPLSRPVGSSRTATCGAAVKAAAYNIPRNWFTLN